MRRNRLNENREESLVYVHYNLRLLSHYCDRAYDDLSYKVWDNNPEDDTIHLEELEAKLLRDEDEAATGMPSPHPPSSSSASANVRVPTIIPLLPPPTSSRGGHGASSYGRGTSCEETAARSRLPQAAHKLDISRGKRPSNR